MKKFFILGLGLILCSCGEDNSIYGKWVEPVPNMPEIKQGFYLEQGGRAESINMATLQYESWEERDGNLILKGKSIGNHQTIDFTEEYEIVSIDKDTLKLKRDDWEIEYKRCEDC